MNRLKVLSMAMFTIVLLALSLRTTLACSNVQILHTDQDLTPVTSGSLSAGVEYLIVVGGCTSGDFPNSYTAEITSVFTPFTTENLQFISAEGQGLSGQYFINFTVATGGDQVVNIFEDGFEVFSDQVSSFAGDSEPPEEGEGEEPEGGEGEEPDQNRLEGLDCTVVSGGIISEGLQTGLGCIPFGNTNVLAIFVVRWGLGIAGGFAFLSIVAATIKIMSSGGDPKKLQEGRELFQAAIAGLLLVVFALLIIRILSVNILGLF